MKILLYSVVFFAPLFLLTSCKVADVKSTSRPVSHEIWDSLLKQHVSADGLVDYTGFQKDSARLNAYLEILSNNHPNEAHWSYKERLAYWINAYNAFTVKIVTDNYPIPSIKDIKNGIPFVNTVWDIKFINIEGHAYDLNNIEHGILRPKFNEPRIHFAVNCASISCPVLSSEAYVAKKIDSQLDTAAKRFLSDKSRNKILSKDKAKLSKIFSWFKGDFTKNKSLPAYISQFTDIELNADADLDFLDYDWRINDQK